MSKLKKMRSPSMDLDALAAEGKLRVTTIDEVELCELRGVIFDAMINRPISDIAMKMAVDMKRNKPVTFRLANPGIILEVRRMLLYDLERIVANAGLTPRCIEKGTQLTFIYVKDR